MSSIVSRWVVRREYRVTADDVDAGGAVRDEALAQWIAGARDAYLERCSALQEARAASGFALRFRDRDLPTGDQIGRPSTVVVSAGVTELFPASFTMAFRMRAYGSPDAVVINATCAVSLEDPETGEAAELGDAIRDELIALEHGARHTN